MEQEPELIMSQHCQTVEQDGYEVRVHIYRGEDSGWILEVEDERGGSTVWEDEFETDDLAFKEFQNALESEGIRSFEVPESARGEES